MSGKEGGVPKIKGNNNNTSQGIQSSEEQIRQKIRAQLQQRLPSLAQQLPDSDRQSSNDMDGGLQSFGGTGIPNASDFFNSDSFRATNTSQDNRVLDSDPRRGHQLQQQYPSAPQAPRDQSTKIVDLSHMQPFQQQQQHQQYFGHGDELEDVDERKSEDEQSQHPSKQQQHPSHPESQPQRQRRNTPPNDVEDTPEAPSNDLATGGEHQLSPLNYEEFVYQQQLIEELIQENGQLKQELVNAEGKLRKVESQLTKTKQWIKDLGNIKEDIQTLNIKAEQVEEYEKITTENEILKSKIQDLETRVNTLSRAGEEQRIDDHGRFERIIQTLTDDNRLLSEKYRMSQQAMMKQDEDIIKWKSLCQQRDQEIIVLHTNWKQLHEDFSNSVKEYKILQHQNDELRQMARNQAKHEHAMMGQLRVREPRSDQTSQRGDDSQKASLRNKSFSGDKSAGIWPNQDRTEKDYPENLPHLRSANVSQDENALKIDYQDKKNIQSAVFNISPPNHQQQAQQTFQNNISVKNYQPIQITIASPSEQTLALAERCQKLEEYCRELIRTNKILDCENRLAIAQILNLTDPRIQLQNLTAALSFIGKSGKIYEKKSKSFNGFQTARMKNHKNKENLMSRGVTSGFQKEMSLRNLNALRQVGAPPLSNVFQNNNSSFIIEKFNGMQSNETSKNLGESQHISRVITGRNQNQKYLIPYHSSTSNYSKPSQRDVYPIEVSHGGQTLHTGTFSNNETNNNNQLQRVVTAVQMMQNIPPLIETKPRVASQNSSLDIHLSELQKEITEKSGQVLNIRKVTEGYYQLNDQIVNLKLDDANSRVLIRVQANEEEGISQTANIRDQVQKITQSIFVDFIDFLIGQGYIHVEEQRESQQ